MSILAFIVCLALTTTSVLFMAYVEQEKRDDPLGYAALTGAILASVGLMSPLRWVRRFRARA